MENRIVQTGETPMYRKLILALGAAVVLGAAALTPTTASAWGGHHWHHGFGFGIYTPTYIAAPDCYVVRRQVQLLDGSWRWRRFTVCD
jgi:hypothetical protein